MQHQDPGSGPARGAGAEPPLEVPAWAETAWPPPRVRLYASRRGLRAGIAAGAALFAVGLGLGASGAGVPAWAAAAAGALLAAACAVRRFAQLPIIEFSQIGACLFLNGPYRRPLFAPWERIGAMRVVAGPHGEGAALAVEIVEGDGLQLPAPRVQGQGAGPGELRWPARTLDTAPERLLEAVAAMRRQG